MDRITHKVRLEHWKRIIEECARRPDGQTARQWLTEHGITKDQYYYWQRRVRQAEYDKLDIQQPVPAQRQALATLDRTKDITFAEIPLEDVSEESSSFCAAAVIKRGNATIALSNAVSDRLLDRILSEVVHA
jgi:putative transposase